MEVLWMIGIGAAGLAVFSIYTTMFSNPKIAGEGFLTKYLKQFGVDSKIVPKELMDKMQDRALRSASVASGVRPSVASKRPKWNLEYQKFLKVEAEVLARYLKNPQSLEHFPGSEKYVEEYRRYGL